MSKKAKQSHVRIANPISGAGYTNMRRAVEYVARGHAVWADGTNWTIRFVEDTARSAMARASARLTIKDRGYDRAAGSGLASIESMRNLPMVNPMAMLVNRVRRKAVM